MTSCPRCGTTFLGQSIGSHAVKCGVTSDELFWQKVPKAGPDECWLWTGALQRDGYAHAMVNRKTVSAHRYVYEALVGPIPAGLDLLHSCDVRRCVNPAHLRPGTHDENMKESKARRRHVYGEKSVHAILTEEQVLEIRRRRAAGELDRAAAAEEFGVRPTTIYLAATGRTWGHL